MKRKSLWKILHVFEDYLFLAEKQRLTPKNLNFLKFFASFDTLLDPRCAKVVEINFSSKIALFEMILRANTPVLCGVAHCKCFNTSIFEHFLYKHGLLQALIFGRLEPEGQGRDLN